MSRTSQARWATSTSALSRPSATLSRPFEPGDFVVGSFWAPDNTCEICTAGYQSQCIHRAFIGAATGTQATLARIPLAGGTLVKTPGTPEPDLIPSLMAASDVLGTGWYAAWAADADRVRPSRSSATAPWG